MILRHNILEGWLPWWLRGKKLPANAGDTGSVCGSQGPLEKETSTHSSTLAWKIPWQEPRWGYSPRAADESHRPQGLNNYNIRRNCVLIDWWIWWIWLHQIFLAPWGSFRWDMQTLSPHTGTLCLGRLTLCCGMWALIPWPRTKCWSRPLGAQILSPWTSKEVPELIL